MNAKRIVPITVALAIASVAAVIAFWPSGPGQKITTTSRNPDQASEDYVKATQARIANLKQRIADEKTAAEGAVNRYAPAAPGKIDDLTTPAADLLRGLPFVARVDVALRVRRPACRIIHIRDYHFVPPNLFNMEVLALMSRALTAEAAGLLYQEHLFARRAGPGATGGPPALPGQAPRIEDRSH
jgi:hypothetical protein